MKRTRKVVRVRQSTQSRKNNFLVTLEKRLGNITEACKASGIARSTFYVWSDESDDFSQKVNDIQDGLLDLAETSLLKSIKKGNVQATIFYLKTKAKHRGYIERQEVEHSGVQPVTVIEPEYVSSSKD